MKKSHTIAYLLVAALGIISVFETRASVFSILLLIIGLAALTRSAHPKKKLIALALWLGLAGATVGIGRFVWLEAVPGIAEARGRASGKKAVSLLREILFAQDAVRRHAMIDADDNGVGSAGRLGELAGADGARGAAPLQAPPLAIRFTPRIATRIGPATEQDGHYIIICLPGKKQDWVTHPGAEVNEALAEKRWLAYAWPAQEGLAHTAAYFIDEHERILESSNLVDGKLRLVGGDKAPDCDDALKKENGAHWRAWRGKTPRKTLPGAAD